ncbi:MAG: hypothetical protein ACR2P8_14655 [Myxococcota bacterium]
MSLTRSAETALLLSLLCTAGCFEPADRRPGTWLSGELVTEPSGDWSFSDAQREILIETRTAYWIPHSVTIVCAADGDKLYVGARNPDGKRWVANVDRDPNVRLKIGDRLFEGRLVPLDSEAAQAGARAAYGRKYGRPDKPPEEPPPMRYWQVVERSAG